MAEERIITTDAPHTTVVHDSGRSGGGAGWFIGIVLVLVLIAGLYFFTQMSGSESAKDNAIANAANQVGDAAQKAGDAVAK